MKTLNLAYIDSISGKDIDTVDDIIRDALTDALSWYLAFRWIFPENTSLDELHKEGVITPYRVKNRIYRQKIREFLKGLIHAGLC